MYLFISYAHADKTIIKEWVVDVLTAGGHTVWFDEKLVSGMSWKQQLDNAIKRSDAFVYCMTPESIASEWCQWELDHAVKLGKPVIPVLMQTRTKLPTQLADIQYVDFTQGPTGDAVARLMGGLQHLSPEHVPPVPTNARGNPSQIEKHKSDSRLFEVAIPACTQIGSESKLKIKISLHNSAGLQAELPELLPSGDSIQQGDVQSSQVRLQFPVDSHTGQTQNGIVCIQIQSEHFNVEAVTAKAESCHPDQYQLSVPPTEDSQTLNFILKPKHSQQKVGLSTVYIHVYQDSKPVFDTYLETQLVLSMNQLPICGDWRLKARVITFAISQQGRKYQLPYMMKILRDPAFAAVFTAIATVIAIIAFIVPGDNPKPTPTALSTPATPMVVALRDLDIRSGPSVDYARLNVLPVDNSLDVLGISEDRLWYLVLLRDGQTGWVLASSSNTRLEGDRSVVDVLTPTAISSSTPMSTPTPTVDLTAVAESAVRHITDLIEMEASAVVGEDLEQIRHIFADNAIIEDRGKPQTYNNAVQFYASKFNSHNFCTAEHQAITITELRENYIRATSASLGTFGANGVNGCPDHYDNPPGSDVWEFERDANGQWQVVNFSFR